ncbi:aspartate/glutamate racemase family protein [Mesorhizobium sp.]|uniref:aspartate/glutamate racemase family protein n=1 Tax=Mesorhizobium sp. TaxID=1871066 RepID=UPI0011F977A7|nr:aspartate/glutamate racemase family protein [Mesorhizobium sp.]TIL29606.1 MAG: hypothetical protein E5Y82_33245 [Mesorhizobium sp.]
MGDGILGILELENKPLTYPGALCAPETFHFPVKRITVRGATVLKLVDGDPSVKDAYVSAARELESKGVTAITTNCGFSALFQTEVAAAVSVPVALSSLLLVPLMAKTLPKGRKVGILTYDSDKLSEHHFAAAGWSSSEVGVSIAGIEGSVTWRQLAEPVPDVPPELIAKDVLTAVKSLMETEPSVSTLVLECAGFTLAAETVRRETGLPVADFVSMANMLVEVSPPARYPR